jgi:hypothetical protein
MEPRELIEKSSFGPDALKVVYQAFDDAWSEIVADYTDDAVAEIARTKLAEMLLSVANDDSTNSRSLKCLALEMMATQKH